MRLLFVFSLLLICLCANVDALEPSALSPMTNDVYVNYQWALRNKGQKLYRDTDDIHPIIVSSKEGYDIQWEDLQELLKKINKKTTIVAVIDSGVSTTHEDIKDKVIDGFNFVAKNEKQQKNISDDIGHGTHIAGIISAHINNNAGIAGVADNIKIMPLKVYSAKQESGQKSFIESVAKAINYAVDNNADVINMSIGWPLIIDLQVVRDAIKRALDRNITIVAGAGNDGHALKVLPCSYEGVICVGATGIAGDIPAFSNYGGQVDIMAPGESILSLWPPLLMPKNFGVRNYNILSGTSQATPLVSAAAAVLKSIFPKITSDEIKARLFESSKLDLTWGNKFSLNGLLQISSAVNMVARPVIRPILKNLDQIHVDPKTKKFKFILPVYNYWTSKSGIKVSVVSNNKNIILKQKNYYIQSMDKGEKINLNIEGEILSINENNKFPFSVEIDEKKVYKHESTLAIKTNLLANVTHKNLEEIKSIVDFGIADSDAEFFSQKTTEDGVEVGVYRFVNKKLINTSRKFIPKAVGLYPHIGLSRVDINLDRSPDYMLIAILKNGDSFSIKHFALDQNLNELYGKKRSEWDFVDEEVLIHQPTLKYVRWSSNYFGDINVPVFISKGKIPNSDLNPDPFDRITSVAKGIYYYTPVMVNDEKYEMRTRLVNSEDNMALIRKSIGSTFDEEINILHFDTNSSGNVDVIIGVGVSALLKYYKVEFDLGMLDSDKSKAIKIVNLNLPQVDLRFHMVKKINQNKIAFFGIYKNDLARLLTLDLDTHEVEDFRLKSDTVENGIVSLLSVDENNKTLNVFIEGVDSFLLYEIDKETGSISVSTSPINRFSYLPGQFFTDSLHPISLAGKQAIYIDSSMINSKNVYVNVAEKGSIVTPIKWTLENCQIIANL